jgi:hypothetical protein
LSIIAPEGVKINAGYPLLSEVKTAKIHRAWPKQTHTRARSEAGLSRLPVTEEIAGSNPVGPAKIFTNTTKSGIIFYILKSCFTLFRPNEGTNMLKNDRLVVVPVLEYSLYVNPYHESLVLGLIDEAIALSASMEIPVTITIPTKSFGFITIEVPMNSDKDKVYEAFERKLADWVKSRGY